jgi:hypothetical protein
VYASGGTQRAALLHLEREPIAQPVSTIPSQAAAKGLSFQSLWTSLSENWLTDDHAGSISFLNAGLKSRAIIARDHNESSRAASNPTCWVLSRVRPPQYQHPRRLRDCCVQGVAREPTQSFARMVPGLRDYLWRYRVRRFTCLPRRFIFIGMLVFASAASIKLCIRNVAFVLRRERLRS